MKKEDSPDMIVRAAKVRHFIAKHGPCTFAKISAHFSTMHCPMGWLKLRGYIRSIPNPKSQHHPLYEAVPMTERFLDEDNDSIPQSSGDDCWDSED